MLLKIHTAYVQESEIASIETGPGGFRVRLLNDRPDILVPCPEERLAAVRREIDAQLLWADVAAPPDDAAPGGPAEPAPKPPRGGYF